MNSFFKIGSNQRERNSQYVRPGTDTAQRVDVLYSYDTPVACYDPVRQKVYTTGKWHSATTSRHIKKWLEQGRFYGLEKLEMAQDALWNLHHLINIWEAEQDGVK